MTFTFICDPGVDDAFALAFLVGSEAPPSQIVATAGNARLEATTRVALGLAQLLGMSVPVRAGVDRALAAEYPEPLSPFFGSDGLCGLADRLPSSDALPPRFEPKSLAGRVLATAPLTAVAVALQQRTTIDQLVWMGGTSPITEDARKTPEFNAGSDPTATDHVLKSDIDVWMVPFDVTRRVTLGNDDLAAISRAGVLGQLLAQACVSLIEREGEMAPHDAVAALAMLNASLFQWQREYVRCDSTGYIVADIPRRRWLHSAMRRPVNIATSVCVDEARRAIVWAVIKSSQALRG